MVLDNPAGVRREHTMIKWGKKLMPTLLYIGTILCLVLASVAGRKWH